MNHETETRWQVRAGTQQTEAIYEPPATETLRGVHVLAHGAGGNMDARNLLREAAILRALGLGVVRFNFFYRSAHRSYPDKMPQLIECYSAVVESIPHAVGADLGVRPPADSTTQPKPSRPASDARVPLYLGGHSMGGRAATMMAAAAFPCAGLILFSYPLHPPGKLDQLRSAHLPLIAVPVLCFNGTRDDFMRRDLMENLLPSLTPTQTRAGWTHHWLDHADHSLNVLKKSGRTTADIDNEISDAAQQWMEKVAGSR